MPYTKERMRQIFLIIGLIAVIFFGALNSSLILNIIMLVLKIISPFLMGGAIAFVLNIPMNFIERKLLKKWNGKLATKFKRPVSMLLSIMFIIAIVFGFTMTVLPQLGAAINSLFLKVPGFINELIAILEDISDKYPMVKEQIETLSKVEQDWGKIVNNIVGFLQGGVGDVLNSTIGFVGSVFNGVTSAVISFIFGIYILGSKETLSRQVKRLIEAFFNDKWNYKIRRLGSLLYKNFTNYITGQCIEAVILGGMFMVSMRIFNMPYAVMIGVLIAFTALIPMVGAFIGCVVGAFLILIDNPIMAVWFVILFFILQQIEGNLIYPKVVGNSVGLPAMWVLMAISVGGSLFGVVGMLVFIPIFSTIYTLLREEVNERIEEKNAAKIEAEKKN